MADSIEQMTDQEVKHRVDEQRRKAATEKAYQLCADVKAARAWSDAESERQRALRESAAASRDRQSSLEAEIPALKELVRSHSQHRDLAAEAVEAAKATLEKVRAAAGLKPGQQLSDLHANLVLLENKIRTLRSNILRVELAENEARECPIRLQAAVDAVARAEKDLDEATTQMLSAKEGAGREAAEIAALDPDAGKKKVRAALDELIAHCQETDLRFHDFSSSTH